VMTVRCDDSGVRCDDSDVSDMRCGGAAVM
jgi:hypothetical protein